MTSEWQKAYHCQEILGSLKGLLNAREALHTKNKIPADPADDLETYISICGWEYAAEHKACPLSDELLDQIRRVKEILRPSISQFDIYDINGRQI